MSSAVTQQVAEVAVTQNVTRVAAVASQTITEVLIKVYEGNPTSNSNQPVAIMT